MGDRRCMCRERPRAGGATATMYPNATSTGPPVMTERAGDSRRPSLSARWRSPARHILNDRAGLLEALEKSGIDSPDLRTTLESASNFLRKLQNEADGAAALVQIVSKVEMRDD